MKNQRSECKHFFNKLHNCYKENNNGDDWKFDLFVNEVVNKNKYFIEKIGRDISFEVIIIPMDEEYAYAIPLIGDRDILEKYNRDSSLGEKLLQNKEWILMPFIPMKENYNMFSLNEEYIKNIYNTDYLISQIELKYKSIDVFVEFIPIMYEIIESIEIGHFSSAIVLQLILIEGVSRAYCEKNELFYRKTNSVSSFQATLMKGIDNWRDKILYGPVKGYKLVLPSDFYEETFLRRIDDGMDMLITFKDYGVDYLYKSNINNPKEMNLSRHDLLHGRDLSCLNEMNIYRLISCIDALAFSITLNPWAYK